MKEMGCIMRQCPLCGGAENRKHSIGWKCDHCNCHFQQINIDHHRVYILAGWAWLYRNARHVYDAQIEMEKAVLENAFIEEVNGEIVQEEIEVDWAFEGF